MPYSPAQQAAIDAIKAALDPASPRNVAAASAYRRRVHGERLARIAMFRDVDAGSYWRLMKWLSAEAPRRFLSLHEARRWLRREIARIRSLKDAGHWAYRDNAARLPGLRDKLTVATYFDRFGASIWSREAA